MMQKTLDPDWRTIIKKAWSFRLIVASALLSGFEFLLSLAQAVGWLDWMPLGIFAGLTFLTIVAAAIARVLVQSNMRGPHEGV